MGIDFDEINLETQEIFLSSLFQVNPTDNSITSDLSFEQINEVKACLEFTKFKLLNRFSQDLEEGKMFRRFLNTGYLRDIGPLTLEQKTLYASKLNSICSVVFE